MWPFHYYIFIVVFDRNSCVRQTLSQPCWSLYIRILFSWYCLPLFPICFSFYLLQISRTHYHIHIKACSPESISYYNQGMSSRIFIILKSRHVLQISCMIVKSKQLYSCFQLQRRRNQSQQIVIGFFSRIIDGSEMFS